MSRLRECSVSHAANLEIAAQTLKADYVLSWKPHPVTMIASYNEDLIRTELRKGLDKLKGCHAIVCLRDTQTLFGEPRRADRVDAGGAGSCTGVLVFSHGSA